MDGKGRGVSWSVAGVRVAPQQRSIDADTNGRSQNHDRPLISLDSKNPGPMAEMTFSLEDKDDEGEEQEEEEGQSTRTEFGSQAFSTE